MIFIDWGFWRTMVIALAATSAFAWIVVKSLQWKARYQLLVVIIGSPIAGTAALVLLFAVLGGIYGCDSHSTPVYSPSHKAAARIETWDAGATGGGTNVLIFQKRGFVTKRVFAGNWKSVAENGLHWLDDQHLEITFYQPKDDESVECTDAGSIRVRCIPYNDE